MREDPVPGQAVTAESPVAAGIYAGITVNGVGGELYRDGSSFFKIWKYNGPNNFQLVKNGYADFSNQGTFAGIEGEAFIGIDKGNYAIELVAGGGGVWSDVSTSAPKFDTLFHQSGYLMTIVSPTPNAAGGSSTTFQWYPTNQFDIGNLHYSDHFDREDFFVGLRPVLSFGGAPASLKDDPVVVGGVYKIQPMVFFTGGRMSVSQQFSGQTDGDAGLKELNIGFAYNNKVTSNFYGVGAGIGASGPLFNLGTVPVGFFANFKGAAEFQDASGSSAWSYYQYLAYSNALHAPNSSLGIAGCTGALPSGTCSTFIPNVGSAKAAIKNLEDSDTTYSVAAELGLSFGLFTNVDLNVGARYRRYAVPQVVLDGVHDARIEFNSADEIGGFAGITARF